MNQLVIGKYISLKRKQKNLTQEQLAEKLGVSNKTISKWETSKGFPDIALIEPLAKALNISKIASKKTAVVFTFGETQFNYDVAKLVKEYGNRLKFSAGIKPMITLEIGTDNEMKILNDVTEFLKTLTKYKKEEDEEIIDNTNWLKWNRNEIEI